MTDAKTPAPVASGTGAGRRSDELLLYNTGPAENPASNLVAFPRRVPRCEPCGWLVSPGSATEIVHHERCTVRREKAEARERRVAALRERWRREERERLRKARGAPIRRPRAPLTERRPNAAEQARIARLRMALCDPETRRAFMAATRLPDAALDRVVLGRSTLAPTLWRRLAVLLGARAAG